MLNLKKVRKKTVRLYCFFLVLYYICTIKGGRVFQYLHQPLDLTTFNSIYRTY